MALDYIKLLKERVTLRASLVALITAGIGIVLLYLSAQKDWWEGHEAWQTVVRGVGGFLFVTVVITVLWELWGKRAFLDEVLAKVQMSRALESAGIVKFTDDFQSDEIDWKSYFHTVSNLDIFFAYGYSWRRNHGEKLKKVAAREGARIRVVLPDYEHEDTLSELLRRFDKTPEELKDDISKAEKYFRSLRPAPPAKGAQIDIWLLPAAPLFTLYCFVDHVAILALYTHRREQEPVPAFVCKKDGKLYKYIRKEFDAMIGEGGLAKCITVDEKKSNE